MAEKTVTKGIVLRETDTKEADKILTVLTAEYGKISVVARGARRKGSKIAAASQLFAFSELTLYEQHGWWMLSEAATISLFDGVRQDVVLLSEAAYFAELTETVATEDTLCGEVLSLLLNALYVLSEQKRDPVQVKAVFELKLLAISGYEPLAGACAVCGAEEPSEPVFDAERGVVTCKGCASGGIALGEDALQAMRFVLYGDAGKLFSFRLSDAAMRRFADACERFALVQLDRPFRTLDFYRQISLPVANGEKQ